MMKRCPLILCVLAGVLLGSCCGLRLAFDRTEPLTICVNECANVTLQQKDDDGNHTNNVILVRIKSKLNDTVARATPSSLQMDARPWSHQVEICGMGGGYTSVVAKIGTNNSTVTSAFVSVIVSRERLFKIVSDVAGWVYFVSWSISYYPQILTNYSRKSVVGLNFDFVSLNIVGFFLYSLYNCGMLFSSRIQREYFHWHKGGINPVMMNDVIFSLHAFFATSVISYQCCVYERGTQKVSWVAKFIILLYVIIFSTSGYLAYSGVIQWLEFLLYCSYIKLTVTMIKYIPQAVMNYSRKSTVGWSIENVMLDFIGGIFSMLQMAVNSYNYNDFASIAGDPTKFGLGLFSAMFDVFFMYQHYVLYRNPYEEHVDEVSSSSETSVEVVQNDANTEEKSAISSNAEMPD